MHLHGSMDISHEQQLALAMEAKENGYIVVISVSKVDAPCTTYFVLSETCSLHF